MGRCIFITYKYGDTSVFPLDWVKSWGTTRVRDYVTELQSLLDQNDHINKGEYDDESLENFKDSTIESKLRDKIYSSSITLIFISPNMKNPIEPENDQWIPWEISYSLKETTRNGRTSRTNALLAIVLPDECNRYDYFMTSHSCCDNGCIRYKTNKLFKIIRDNMFNVKYPSTFTCPQSLGGTVYQGEASYIKSVRWIDFIGNPNYYLDLAYEIKENLSEYNITKTVQQ